MPIAIVRDCNRRKIAVYVQLAMQSKSNGFIRR